MAKTPRYLPASGYDPDDARERIGRIVGALEEAYPKARTALAYRNPYELLIATILSAQTTDENVNKVTPGLFERFPSPEDLAAADPEEVEEIVRSTGFFRQKTKSIMGAAGKVVEDFGGEVPKTLEELTTLPGVARKTANVVMANCFPEEEHGIFVDTHVRRLAQRLALTDQEDPDKIERDLMELLPADTWADAPHQLILLGRGPCSAKEPRHDECPLLEWCPTGLEATGASPPRRSARARGGGRSHGRAGRGPGRRSGGGTSRGRPRRT